MNEVILLLIFSYIELASDKPSVEQTSTENVDQLNEELHTLKTQYEELEKMNQQLLIEKEDLTNQLNDRSLVVGHHSTAEPNPFEDETPIESTHEVSLMFLIHSLYLSLFSFSLDFSQQQLLLKAMKSVKFDLILLRLPLNTPN